MNRLQGPAVGLSPATSEHRVPGPGRGKPEGDLTQPGLPGQCFWDEGEALEQPGVPGTLKWSQSRGWGGGGERVGAGRATSELG